MTTDARLVLDWLTWLEAGNLSPNTLRNRRYLLGTFIRAYRLAGADTEDIQAHLAGLRSASSKSSHLAALRSFYRWAIAAGRLDHDPTALVRSIRVPSKDMLPVPKVLLDRALLLTDERTRFMLLLGARAGLRREEIATLHSRCIGVDHLTILGKGSKTRRIYIHPDLRPYLDRLAAEGGWAFPSHVYPGKHVTPETVQRAVTAALGEPWTTHSLRRYAATSWYAASKDIRAVQALLGHTSPATTAKYVHADDDAMAAAILRAA